MKKIIFAVIVLAIVCSVPAFAEETKKDEMPGMGMGMPHGMGKGMPMSGMGQKNCAMSKAQMTAFIDQHVTA